MTQEQVGIEAKLNKSTVGRYENGARRMRRSTLERIARALVDEDLVESTLDGWVAIAGPGIAPESRYADRVARRRERRWRQYSRRAADEMRKSAAISERLGQQRSAAVARRLADQLDAEAAAPGPPDQSVRASRARATRSGPHPADVRQPWQQTKAPTPRIELRQLERLLPKYRAEFAPDDLRNVDIYLERLRRFVRTGRDDG